MKNKIKLYNLCKIYLKHIENIFTLIIYRFILLIFRINKKYLINFLFILRLEIILYQSRSIYYFELDNKDTKMNNIKDKS